MTGERRSCKVRSVAVGLENCTYPPVGVPRYGEIVLKEKRKFIIGVIMRAPGINPLTMEANVFCVNVDASWTSTPAELRRNIHRHLIHHACFTISVNPNFECSGIIVQYQHVERFKKRQ